MSLQIGIAGPLITIKGYGADETVQAFLRVQELSAEVGAAAETYPVMYGRWAYSVSQSRYRESTEVARQLLELALQRTDTGPIQMGLRWTGISQFLAGRPGYGQAKLRKAVELYNPDEHASLRLKFGQDPCAAALTFSSLCLWELGYTNQARAALHQSIERSGTLDHVNTRAYVEEFGGAALHQPCSNPSALKEIVACLITLAEEHNLGLWKMLISIVDGWVLARHDDNPVGLVRMREALDAARATFTFMLPYRLALLADAYRASGEPDHSAALFRQKHEARIGTSARATAWSSCNLICGASTVSPRRLRHSCSPCGLHTLRGCWQAPWESIRVVSPDQGQAPVAYSCGPRRL